MSRLLSSLTLLLLLLLVAVQPASGMMSVSPENRVWDFFPLETTHAWETPSSGQYGTKEGEAWGYEFASDVCEGTNLYAYVGNGPIGATDPLGLFDAPSVLDQYFPYYSVDVRVERFPYAVIY